MKKAFRLFLSALLVFTLSGAPAFATGPSDTPVSISMSMTVPETLTISCTPTVVDITYSSSSGGTGTANSTVTCTTTWALNIGHNGVNVEAYLASATAALTDGPTNIPSSELFANIDSTSAVACTGTNLGNVVAGLGCGILTYAPVQSATKTDTFLFSLAGLGVLAPGVYTGTVTITALVF